MTTVQGGDIRALTRLEVVAAIRRAGVVPVVRVPSPEQAHRAVEGVISGGIPVVEITLTIPGALRIIEDISKRYGDALLIGAGTVLTPGDCSAALAAGAQFIVSPALVVDVIETARLHNKVCIPGALTPTEVWTAWSAGADVVKVFPCGSVGGPQYIRTLRGPFPQITLMPTAGVKLDNVAEFLRAGAVAVGVGEPIFARDALERGEVYTIRENARQFAEAVRAARTGT